MRGNALGCTAMLGYASMHWVALGFNEMYLDALGTIGMRKDALGCNRIDWDALGCTKVDGGIVDDSRCPARWWVPVDTPGEPVDAW